jgi:hypothetical protein
MNTCTAYSWQKRYLVSWYRFVKDPDVKTSLVPLLGGELETFNKQLIALFFKHNLPEVCWNAARRHFMLPAPSLQGIIDLIQPIQAVKKKDGSITVDVAPEVTQTELEDFIRLKFSSLKSKPDKRLNAKAEIKKTMVINKRVYEGKAYQRIQEEMAELNINTDVPNLRTAVSDYNKRMQKDFASDMRV